MVQKRDYPPICSTWSKRETIYFKKKKNVGGTVIRARPPQTKQHAYDGALSHSRGDLVMGTGFFCKMGTTYIESGHANPNTYVPSTKLWSLMGII
jgi:hypothetical protein